MNKIAIHKNNTGTVKVTLADYIIASGHTLAFTVKKSVVNSDEEILISKTATGDGTGTVEIELTGQDTNIPVGNYKWDLKDITQNLTLIGGDFVIIEVVLNGEPQTGIQSEIQKIEGTVDVVTVNTDYSLLTHKPKINGEEVDGDKTSADLNMYTKTETNSLIATKQNILTAGSGIDITGDVISAKDFELINTADFTTEAVSSVEFTKDSDGNDLNLKLFRLEFYLNADAQISDGVVNINDLPSIRNIGSSCIFDYYNGNKNKACVFQTLLSVDKITTLSVNLAGGVQTLKQPTAQLVGADDYQCYAPYYKIMVSWGTACTGKIYLYGVK